MAVKRHTTILVEDGVTLNDADLVEVYFNVPILEDQQVFLYFTILGNHFQLCTLPFGLSMVLRTLIMVIVAVALQHKCICLSYIDSRLILAKLQLGVVVQVMA